MSRKKLELTEKEAKVIGSIPSAKKAAAIWSKFAERTIQAREDRKALGVQLVAVRKALAKPSGKSLFHRWLKVQGITTARAYTFMALAGGAKPRSKRKSYVQARAFEKFRSLLSKAESKGEKVQILHELVKWVKSEYNIDEFEV